MSSKPPKEPGEAKTTKTKHKVRACAECRRLKLRCDRIFPCQACNRRGCAALCPDKCFTDEATPSSLKANSLRSREEIKQLRERLAQVEAVLADVLPDHPILQSRLTDPSSPPDDSVSPGPSVTGSASANSTNADIAIGLDETVDIMATLSIGDDGTPMFDGTTTDSENFSQVFPSPYPAPRLNSFPYSSIKPGHDEAHPTPYPISVEQPSLPQNIRMLSVMFPFAQSSVNLNVDINELTSFLPPPLEVLRLCDTFWYHLSLGSAPISHPQFMRYVYNYFFPTPETDITKRHLERSDAHRLGLLFSYMALGALTDLQLPLMNAEAEKWYQLSRAALTLDPACENPSIPGIQCMVAMAWYIRHAPPRATPGYRWAFPGLIIKMANSLGILRDSRRWLTDPDEIDQREVLCWELMSLEIWQSFTAGRPCSLDLTLVDCAKPTLEASSHADMEGFVPGYSIWRHKFFPLVNSILLVVQRPGSVKYSEILALERELRFCRMPEELEACHISPMANTLTDLDITKHLQGITALMWRESACAMLHRRFLALAMQQNSGDPRESPFWYSAFQAGFGACWIVKAHMTIYHRHPELISRVPAFWSTAFAAAVILGSIGARYGNEDFANAVVKPFFAVCELFISTAETSIQPANAAKILQRLQERVRTHLETSPAILTAGEKPADHLDLLISLVNNSPARSSLSNSPSFSSTSISTPPAQNLSGGASPQILTHEYSPGMNSISDANTVPLHQHSNLPQTSSTHPDSQNSNGNSTFPVIPNLQLLEQLWAAPDLSLPDSNLGLGQYGQPLYTSVDQTWQPYLSTVSDTTYLGTAANNDVSMQGNDHFVPATGVPESTGELGQWDQYLDKLGMWDGGGVGAIF